MSATVSEQISRTEAVLTAAREFKEARAAHVDAVARAGRFSTGRTAAARQRRDRAIEQLVVAVEELDG